MTRFPLRFRAVAAPLPPDSRIRSFVLTGLLLLVAFLALFTARAWGAEVAMSSATAVSRNVTLLAHLDNYGTYSACWTYVHSDGREYAVLGTMTGTSIVNVTNPSEPYEVTFIPGLTSQWREMKSFGNYIYISTEAQAGGIQIVKMTDPENPVLVNTYVTGFNRAHTLTLDASRGLLLANGTRFNAGPTGLRILSLANPEAPVEIGIYAADYVHDAWVRNDTLYASCITSAHMRVFDFSDPTNPFDIVSWTYPGARTHSGEKSQNGRYLYVCDEQNYGTMKVFDMANLFPSPQIVHIYSANPLAIAHNIHVVGNTGYMAYYTEGIRLLDLRDPSLPVEWGYYDTYPSFSGGFHGVWETAVFPSGTIIASDIETGLYVFGANPAYGVVKVRVRDAGQAPLTGVHVETVGEAEHIHSNTQAAGAAGLALGPGMHTLKISKFGYQTKILPVTVSLGTYDSMQVTLPLAPMGTLGGTVRRASDNAGLQDAVIEEPHVVSTTSGAGGAYFFGSIPAGTYNLRAERPGYAPAERIVTVQQGEAQVEDWRLLRAAWYDSCDTDKGWSLSTAGDNAIDGLWVRAKPVGSSVPGAAAAPRASSMPGVQYAVQHPEPEEGGFGEAGPVQPGDDYSPGNGFCFVTANGISGGDPNIGDVDGGRTTLTTPPLNMAGMIEPTVGFRLWYYMNTPGEPDSLLVECSSNGTSWVRVMTMRESRPEWHLEKIRVKDFIVPGSTVRFRFIAQDEGLGTIVEAAVDDFEFHDAMLVPSSVEPITVAPPVQLEAPRPNPANPARGGVTIGLRLRTAGAARVLVYDVSGRLVARLWDGLAPAGLLPVTWDGTDLRGRRAGSGVYWVRADAAGEMLSRRLVLAR